LDLIQCQAIELNPKDADAFIDRGVAYANLKQFEKAIQDYNQAIEFVQFSLQILFLMPLFFR
jgi:Flp pilus assembly protein TadD